MDSVDGIGEKISKDPLSGSWCPCRHHLDLNLKFPIPGNGFFLLIILLVMTLSGHSLLTFFDSSTESILAAPRFKIEDHSSESESLKPAISSGVACFMLNSAFLALALAARRTSFSGEGLTSKKLESSSSASSEGSTSTAGAASWEDRAWEDGLMAPLLFIRSSLSNLLSSLRASRSNFSLSVWATLLLT